MIFPIVLSIFLFYKPQVSYSTFREKLVEMLNRRRTSTYILTGLSAVLIAVSIFFSLSRGGIISLCLSVIFFGVLLGAGRAQSRGRTVVIAAGLLILLSVTWIGWDPILSRFEKIRDQKGHISDNRAAVWGDTTAIISDFPLFGSGFGTFVDVYPNYRTFPGDEVYDHAHNDYLELVSDGGVAGALLYIWFFSSVVSGTLRTYGKRKEIYSIYLYVGGLSGMVYIFFHSITDFNLHIGSNGLYFFFLAGVLVSASNTRLREGLSPTILTPRDGPPVIFSNVPAAITLTLCVIFHVGGFIGKYYHSSLRDITVKKLDENVHVQLVLDTEKRAVFFDPLEPSYRLGLAEIEAVGLGPEAALGNYKKAVTMNPFNSYLVQRLGLAYSDAGDGLKADKLLRAGLVLDGKGSSAYRTYAAWLFEKGRTQEGIANIKEALSNNPGRTREFIILMVRNRMTKSEIGASMPDRVEPHLVFARHLAQTGYDDMADDEYRRAFDFVEKEKVASPAHFTQAAGHFIKKAAYDDAVAILRTAVRVLPRDIDLRLSYGDLYLKMGMEHRAKEEYEKALLIDPASFKVKRKIDEATRDPEDDAGDGPAPE
ncbi:MAG: O-antigen ligase family protein [Nitrospirae bacterium]|nr:O-antigen ligase family protein [Nitrospirota bacterium]